MGSLANERRKKGTAPFCLLLGQTLADFFGKIFTNTP